MEFETLDYYEQNAEDFSRTTLYVDFSETQQLFLKYMPEGAHILDFGCGAGRDTKCFLEQGYQVTAIDGSEALCQLASKYTGIPVYELIHEKPELHKRFEACYRDNLHSIWAGQELYRKGNSREVFYHILEKNMMPVYDSARRQGYEIWNY